MSVSLKNCFGPMSLFVTKKYDKADSGFTRIAHDSGLEAVYHRMKECIEHRWFYLSAQINHDTKKNEIRISLTCNAYGTNYKDHECYIKYKGGRYEYGEKYDDEEIPCEKRKNLSFEQAVIKFSEKTCGMLEARNLSSYLLGSDKFVKSCFTHD